MARAFKSARFHRAAVVQTLVAEVYGPDLAGQTQVAQQIKTIFQHTPGVVDTDWYVEDPEPRLLIARG